MKFRVARSAAEDLGEIWAYVAEKASIETAERLIDSLTQRFVFLARNPEAGRRRADLRTEVRSFPAGSYRIYNRKERAGTLRILHVRHAARDESKLFG